MPGFVGDWTNGEGTRVELRRDHPFASGSNPGMNAELPARGEYYRLKKAGELRQTATRLSRTRYLALGFGLAGLVALTLLLGVGSVFVPFLDFVVIMYGMPLMAGV